MGNPTIPAGQDAPGPSVIEALLRLIGAQRLVCHAVAGRADANAATLGALALLDQAEDIISERP